MMKFYCQKCSWIHDNFLLFWMHGRHWHLPCVYIKSTVGGMRASRKRRAKIFQKTDSWFRLQNLTGCKVENIFRNIKFENIYYWIFGQTDTKLFKLLFPENQLLIQVSYKTSSSAGKLIIFYKCKIRQTCPFLNMVQFKSFLWYFYATFGSSWYFIILFWLLGIWQVKNIWNHPES